MKHLFSSLLLVTPSLISSSFQPATKAEQQFIDKSNRPFYYKQEHIPVVEVINCMELGKLTALRFLEWIIQNPQGVIALPTGKTPEFFIKFLQFYKDHWLDPGVQQELKTHGIHTPSFPDTSQLKFVQLDEFYPIDPSHENSFFNYVNRYYLPLLNLKKENTLLINPAQITNVEKFCNAYEEKINEWGGIGFFLGGIGTDGHIAFNIHGSKHNSLTRLVTLNYESACGIAGSLGGMEYARDKTAITIGLDTITRKKDATIIIIAAGEGKAPMIAHAIESDDQQYPATVLQKAPGARFYITQGAASHLHEPYIQDIKEDKNLLSNLASIDQILATISLRTKKPIAKLTHQDILTTDAGKILAKKTPDLQTLTLESTARFRSKITSAVPTNHSILHTSPHHDDIMLSYHPRAVALLEHNRNHIAYVTSGFNAVSNTYIKNITSSLTPLFIQEHSPSIFSNSYNELLKQYAQSFDHHQSDSMNMLESCIAAQHIAHIYHCNSPDDLLHRIEWIQNEYLTTIKPGEKDDKSMQLLKGALRESEADRMWRIHGLSLNHITHLRSRFYTGEYFTPKPNYHYDVKPILSLLNQHKPDIVTVTFDPEGTGPDTHYKVLQMVAESLHDWQQENHTPLIWGYRNVWYRFQPYDVTRMIPVSKDELDTLHTIFINCFSTQKDAPFPSHFYDGPFSRISIQIQEEQLGIMRTLLGKEFFETHPDLKIRNAAGLCFIKEMTTEGFLNEAQKLREYTELINE